MIRPMKRRCGGIILFLILWSATLALAEEPTVPQRIATKLTRGAANFTTGWMEVPKQIYLVGQSEGWVTGALRGPIDGLGMFIARTIAGAYEVLTFPLPLPPHYQPMLFPEYVWQPDSESMVAGAAPLPAGSGSDGAPTATAER